jgi:hypothetical protein
MSRKSTSVTVVAGPSSIQYSDVTNLTATVTPASAGGQNMAGSVQFWVGATSIGSAPVTVTGGVATSTLSYQTPLAASSYAVTALFTTSNNNFTTSPTSAPSTLTVTKEEATLAYNGSAFFSTGSATATSGPVTLGGQVSLPESDGTAGNPSLNNATVYFWVFNGRNLTAVPDYVFGPATANTSGVATLTTTLPTDNYTVIVSFVPTGTNAGPVNGFFAGPDSVPSVVTLYQPIADQFVTGGGWIVDPGTNNTPVGISPTNNHGNFGFTVKIKSGTTPQGQSVYVFRGADGYDYVVKSNSWSGGFLGFLGASLNQATFGGRCNVTVINPTTGLALSGLGGGNYSFKIDVVDNGPGTTDTYAITVTQPNGSTLYHQAGTAVSQLLLGGGGNGGGNIVVHGK